MSYRQDYWKYLKSDIWEQKREAALTAAHSRCQLCNNSNDLNIHHRVYPDILGDEPISDLTVLCRKCHQLFHGIKRKPTRNMPPEADMIQAFLNKGGIIKVLPVKRERAGVTWKGMVRATGLPW